MSESKNNDCIDVMKAILALFVMIMHVGLGIKKFTIPILRTAVPLFFTTSSFFFFSKVTYDWRGNDKHRILKFTKRNLYLYIFWFVILFPITLSIRKYFSQSLLSGIFQILKSFFLGSTFKASWFIMALVEGVLIIYFLGRVLSDRIILIITFFIYIVCCLASNYYNLLPSGGIISTILDEIPFAIYNNVFVALFWIEIGKIISKYNNKIKKLVRGKNFRYTGLLIAALILLYLEYYFIYKFHWSVETDCYLMLIPVTVLVFAKVISMNKTFKLAPFMRSFSTVAFCSHFSLTIIYQYILQMMYGSDIVWLRFLITIFTCIMLTMILVKLSKYKYLKWLKYSY